MEYKKIIKALWLGLCMAVSLLAMNYPLQAQSVKWRWEAVAPGVWKAQIGETQSIDLLRAAGASPRLEALKSLGDRTFPLPEQD